MSTMGNTSVASSWREFSCLPKAYNFGKENQLKLQFVINFVIDSGLGMGGGVSFKLYIVLSLLRDIK